MRAGVLLGVPRRRRAWLPPGVMKELRKDVISTCIIPTGGGDVCGERFYVGQEMLAQRHTGVCAARNEGHIHALAKQHYPDVLKPWDPEFHAWLHRNHDAVVEGRKRV